MKIALIISSLSSGGAERVMADMANFWVRHGVEVLLITFSNSNVIDFYKIEESVRRFYIGERRQASDIFGKVFFNFSRLLALRQVLQREKPDCAISFMDSTNVLAIIAAIGTEVDVIVSVRNNPAVRHLPLAWRFARKITYRYARYIVAQTAGAAKWITRCCGGNVVVIPNPLRPMPVNKVKRETIVLAVGRMIPEKGHDILVRAFAEISALCPEWSLVLLGDGPIKEDIQKLADILGIHGRILMPGNVLNVEGWMARAGLFVLPSRSEGFPNALMEAMGMGLAVIASDCDHGPRDIIRDGEDGLLFASGEATALAQRMSWLIQDADHRVQMGIAARKAVERFAQDKVMAQWAGIIAKDIDN